MKLEGKLPETRSKCKKKASILGLFLSVPLYCLKFLLQFHTTCQVIIERRTCLYAKGPYKAMNDVCFQQFFEMRFCSISNFDFLDSLTESHLEDHGILCIFWIRI